MELRELKQLHDKAYNANQVTREQASDDLVFYWVSQWDDQLLSDSQLQYRGEFNILRKAGRQIMGDLRLNPVQPDFKPKSETRKDDAEILDGLYRADDRRLTSQEAYDYSTQDAIVCGFGAWELYTEYESNQVGDLNQVIRRKFIPEANNTVFWDPNATRLDKSDANYVSILFKYSEDGYADLVEELTGERPAVNWSSFAQPEESYAFPWVAEQKKIYVTTFYKRKKVKDKVLTFNDPFGEQRLYRESDLDRAEIMDGLIDSGFTVAAEKVIERWEITRYIASGERVLSEDVVAGENIPVVPVYGERSTVEGEEYYEGITRLAKDPQRLRNFQLSYLADIVSRSPRPKPIFTPEQIQGFEPMYEENGADNNYPYLLQNSKDANGQPLPVGPVAQMPEQPMPTSLVASIELTRQAVEDVANPGLPQDIADPDLSGKAVLALQNRMDQQSYIYQHNFKFAKRRDAEIYASMAGVVYDTPRSITIETKDGTTRQIQIMESIINDDGEVVVLNDLTNMEFDVYAEIGHSYQTQKQQTMDNLSELMAGMQHGDPMREILMLKYTALMDGVDFEDVREYSRNQLILKGIKQPETEEEIAMVQGAQQNQAPDPNMILAQAEMAKGQAAMMREQREMVKDQAKIANDNAQTQIDQFKAETDRIDTQIDAQKAGAEINYKNIQAFGQQIDNAMKTAGAFRSSVNQ